MPNMTRPPWTPEQRSTRHPNTRTLRGAPAPCSHHCARGSRAPCRTLQPDFAQQISALSCFLVQGWVLRLGPVLPPAPGQAPGAAPASGLSRALGLPTALSCIYIMHLETFLGEKGIFVHEFFNTLKCCLYCVQQMRTLQPI